MSNKYKLLVLLSIGMLGGCEDGKTDAPECTNGQKQCEGSVLAVCQDEAWVLHECGAAGCAAETLACGSAASECTDGEMKCSGNFLQKCQDKAWTQAKDCGEFGCNAGEKACNSEPTDCKQGELKCDGNAVLICAGKGWSTAYECGDAGCNSENNKCNEVNPPTDTCTDGEIICADNVLKECQGSAWKTKQECGDAGCASDQKSCNEGNITVSPRKGLMTNESGTSTSFTVVLNKKPTSDVEISLSGSPDTEGKIDLNKLVFTPENWDKPQTVTVSGVEDNEYDGNKIYTIEFKAISQDNEYNGMKIEPVYVVNAESKCKPQLQVLVEDGFPNGVNLMTDENGKQSLFIVALNTRPAYDVHVKFKSTNPKEAKLVREEVTLSPEIYKLGLRNIEAWTAESVYVEGVADGIKDGDGKYSIVLESVTSDDPAFDGITQMVDVMASNGGKCAVSDKVVSEIVGLNLDADGEANGIIAEKKASSFKSKKLTRDLTAAAQTSENGDWVDYNVKLKKAPAAGDKVIIIPVVTDTTEAVVSPARIEVDSKTWDQGQTFRVTGLDDDEYDGDILYGVKFISLSDDLLSDNLESDTLILKNMDNEAPISDGASAPMLIVTKPSSHAVLYTNEDGMSKTLKIRLNSQPKSDVKVKVYSTDPTEGVSSAYDVPLLFTPLNWNEDQSVLVTGVDDNEADGNIDYKIYFKVSSEDANYQNIPSEEILFRNFDNDGSGSAQETPQGPKPLIEFSNIVKSGDNHIKEGDSLAFTFRLNEWPASYDTAKICFGTSNKKELEVTNLPLDDKVPGCLDIKKQSYHDSRLVIVSGVKDNTKDGDQQVYLTVTSNINSWDINKLQSVMNMKFIVEDIDGGVNTTVPEAQEPLMAMSPNSCNYIGTTTSEGTSQIYQVHLSKQPKNNVTIKFSLSDNTLAKFKGGKTTRVLTFKPSDYQVDQTIEIVGQKAAADTSSYEMTYTVESADTEYKANLEKDPYQCRIELKHNPKAAETKSGTQKLRIMAANTTSTFTDLNGKKHSQEYGDPGMNMFYAMNPDIILAQEFRSSAQNVVKGLEERFGEKYVYVTGDGRIGNGIVTKAKYPIIWQGAKASEIVADRMFDAAIIDIPGDKDILALSLHLNTKRHYLEMPEVVSWVKELMSMGDYYLVVGGDFNTTGNNYVDQYFSSILATDASYPRDQFGNYATNSGRNKEYLSGRKHYDWLLVDQALQAYAAPTVVGSQTFPYGFVLDSRVHTPLSDIAPVQYEDSAAADMQHMPVIRDFVYEYTESNLKKCTEGTQICISSGVSQCKNNQWVDTKCASGMSCDPKTLQCK